MQKFYLEDYLKKEEEIREEGYSEEEIQDRFQKLCNRIYESFEAEWSGEQEGLGSLLDLQKKAIIGYEKEVAFFMDKIREYLRRTGEENILYPSYYNSPEEGVYHENWGLAGLAQWFHEDYQQSSSAKIIGERIYFMEEGRMVLKKQRISRSRREQLVRALMLRTPEERLDQDFHELYLLDGTRITIYSDQLTKKGQDAIIFRRYIVPEYSFEEQARRHTIPKEGIELFREMVKIGYNTVFLGSVRSAKTSFLSTWQSYENEKLEGVMVETDPEIPLHHIMEKAPIIQIVADNQRLSQVSKNLLRSDADYFILAEARDGTALDLAVRIANKGSRRMKMTFHSSDPMEFCYDVANEITRSVANADLKATTRKVAKSFHYIFHFVQLQDKSQKRLKGIYEIQSKPEKEDFQIIQICRYRYETDDWQWRYRIGKDKAVIGQEEDPRAFQAFDRHLQALAQAYPMEREAKEAGEENEKTGYGLEEKEDKKEGKEEEWEVSIGSRLSVSDYTA